MKKIVFALFFLLTTSNISCSLDDDKECVGFEIAPVVDVNAPATGKVNEPVIIEVDFQVYNGCGRFDRFVENSIGNSINIRVQAKYEGCVCPQIMEVLTAQYEFTAEEPGIYTLQFMSGTSEFVEVDVEIVP